MAKAHICNASKQVVTDICPNKVFNKPIRGWLHSDHLFSKDAGVCYAVRYIGCLEVTESMKALDFDTRSSIAKECINRVCESSGLKTVDKKRSRDKRITRMLGQNPLMNNAGMNAQLSITSISLKLSLLDSNKVIFVHQMPNISFASGGDADTLDFVAYVAKNGSQSFQRCCYVIECGSGKAQDVITTIGQAFELRFKEFLKRTPTRNSFCGDTLPDIRGIEPLREAEYYNDMPGKVPPEPSDPYDVLKNADINLKLASETHFTKPNRDSTSSNLIDLCSDLVKPAQYVNEITCDPFDMSPFSMSAINGNAGTTSLSREPWFHGPISRIVAESLLQRDGDFLVRESPGLSSQNKQYVLTGMQSNVKKHLLLIDPVGVVRTKDRTFDSVTHLINFHLQNGLPIVSAESVLRLITPVSNTINTNKKPLEK